MTDPGIPYPPSPWKSVTAQIRGGKLLMGESSYLTWCGSQQGKKAGQPRGIMGKKGG